MKHDPFKLLLELDAWDAAASGERLASALAVAGALPKRFAFQGLATHTLGDQTHEIAVFDHADCSFALLPGRSQAVLGYDRSCPYRPGEAQSEDWQIVYEEYGCTIEEYLDECLAPLRRAGIAPFLMEVAARPFDYAQDGADQSAGYSRVLDDCGEGFRLPAADEWEYACAAGTRTLFRWGDHCPVSNSYDDCEFTGHRQPNAFGLRMNASTYDTEICQGPRMRGGDGGGSVCGGIGKVVTWLPLASAFRIPGEEVGSWWIDEVLVRRVWPILAPDAP